MNDIVRGGEAYRRAASILLVCLALGLASSALVFGAGCASAPPESEKRAALLRSEIAPRLAGLEEKATVDPAGTMAEASFLLSRLSEAGLSAQMPATEEEDSPLLSSFLQELFLRSGEGLSLSFSPSGGILESDERVTLSARDGSGKPLARLPLRATWAVGEESAEIRVLTNEEGKASLIPPKALAFPDGELRLSASTAFAAVSSADPFLESFDAATETWASYLALENADAWFASRELPVPGGEFQAGPLPGDSRAGSAEKARLARVEPFVMDAYPVTNALYAAYLAESGTEAIAPEFWGNPDYAQPDQPVVGLSRGEAESFAAWLSEKRGHRYRLPTEEEFERAARAGKDSIYPWGDQAPSDGELANCLGNGRFEGPSPVGSFPDGKNSLGLSDMAGNVWQWTSSNDGGEGGLPPMAIAKGGSWMDGPIDLRVSNRRFLFPSERSADIGFRLVREVNDEE